MTLSPVVGDVRLELTLPEAAIAEPSAELPTLDVSSIPGAEVVERRGWQGGGVTLRAACVRAPSDRWAPGVEDLVLERATAIAASAAPGVGEWSASPIDASGGRLTQRLAGRGTSSGAPMRGLIRHALAFAGEHRDVGLCSIVCVEPEASTSCANLVDASDLHGTFAPPPPPSLGVRAILLAADHPHEAMALAAAFTIAAIVWILARRPRPRWH